MSFIINRKLLFMCCRDLKLLSLFCRRASDKEYYNDLPGKMPPDLFCDTKLPIALSELNIKVNTIY